LGQAVNHRSEGKTKTTKARTAPHKTQRTSKAQAPQTSSASIAVKQATNLHFVQNQKQQQTRR